MTIHYLTEEEHVERMAKAIYLCHVRRVTLITGWNHLREDRREAFRSLAKDAVAGADRIRAAAREGSFDSAQSQAIGYCEPSDAAADGARDDSAFALTLAADAEETPQVAISRRSPVLNSTR
jgi:hypothetical protein